MNHQTLKKIRGILMYSKPENNPRERSYRPWRLETTLDRDLICSLLPELNVEACRCSVSSIQELSPTNEVSKAEEDTFSEEAITDDSIPASSMAPVWPRAVFFTRV